MGADVRVPDGRAGADDGDVGLPATWVAAVAVVAVALMLALAAVVA